MEPLSRLLSDPMLTSSSISLEQEKQQVHLSTRLFNDTMKKSESLMDYWSTQRRGANFFNKTPSPDWFVAAKRMGIEFARMAPDKWKSEQRDFLIGNADEFEELSSKDCQALKEVLDDAHRNDIKVVITFLSLPGSRWKQNNQDKDDLRLWHEGKYKKQSIEFWKKLALLVKEHPAVVGYNVLNEPHPELLSGSGDYRELDFEKWYQSVKGSLADLNLFYTEIVTAIREIDQNTPIVLDTGMYATPWTIRYLSPLNDNKILYSFHMYEPYAYTCKGINNGRYAYPGTVPVSLESAESNDFSNKTSINWDKAALVEFLNPVSQWQKQHSVPSSQILVGEFGCNRVNKGAEAYFADLIEIFNSHNWHWAFYSFREDCWDGMDYELGSGKLDQQYWDLAENGKNLDEFRVDNPLFSAIKAHLTKESFTTFDD